MKPSVLISGASSGIGAATADWLVARGFEVFGTSRHPEPHRAARPAIRWIAMDVRDEASVRKGVEQVLTAATRLDALVCNAGFGIFGSVEEVAIPAAQEQFETNFFGVLRLMRAVVPSMRKAGRGRIVVVGSLAGRAPMPFRAHYSASKAALEALVFSLYNELGPHGVHATLVEPGDINTRFEEHADWPEVSASVYGARAEHCARVMRESLKEAPSPDVVARAIHRALTARRPRVRYTVGPESKLLPLGRRLLPDRLVLRLIRKHFNV